MDNTISVQVEISLSDFFDSEQDRKRVFQDALNYALMQKINECDFFYQNLASYIFELIKEEAFAPIIEDMKARVIEASQEYTPDRWELRHNKHVDKCINDALAEMRGDIMARTKAACAEWMACDNDRYNSFSSKVADACVSQVFDTFVSAMVERENNK